MTCLNESTKEELIKVIDDTVSDTKEAEILAEFIDGIQKCTTSDTSKGRKNQRPLSKYNLHMKKCMGEQKKEMKPCVQEWREIKKQAGS